MFYVHVWTKIGVQLDAVHEKFDPERVLLGLPHHEPARCHDRPSVQQSNAVGHKHDVDRSPQSHHTDISGGFRLARASAHKVLTRNHSGIYDDRRLY